MKELEDGNVGTGTASKAKPRFCTIEKDPVFVDVTFRSAKGKIVRIVNVDANGQAEVKKTDLYQLLDEKDRELFKAHFGKSTSNCFLKANTFKEI